MLSEGLLLFLWLAASSTAGVADSLPALRLLASSPAAETAVVVSGTGEALGNPSLVRRGEEIGETGLTLVAVLPDRIEVRQDLPAEGGAPSEGRRLWVYRSREGGPSRIQVLDRAAPPAQKLGAPSVIGPSFREGPSDPSVSADRGSTKPSEPEPQPSFPSDPRSEKPAPPPGEAQ